MLATVFAINMSIGVVHSQVNNSTNSNSTPVQPVGNSTAPTQPNLNSTNSTVPQQPNTNSTNSTAPSSPILNSTNSTNSTGTGVRPLNVQPQQIVCPPPINPGCIQSSSVTLAVLEPYADALQYETLVATVNVVATCNSFNPCPISYTFNITVSNSINGNVVASYYGPPNPLPFPGSNTVIFTFQLPQTTNDVGVLNANVLVRPLCLTAICFTNPLLFATNTIKVYQTPAVSISPSNAVLDSGQSEIYSGALSGGKGPFNLALETSGATVATLSNLNAGPYAFGPIVPPAGTDTYNVVAVDTGVTVPYNFNSVPNTIIVNVAPTATSLTPSNALLDSGQWEVYTVAISGGVSPYTVNLVSASGTVVNTITGSSGGVVKFGAFQPPVGTDTYNVVATDSSPMPVTFASAPNTITVSNTLGVPTLSPATANVDAGEPTTLTATLPSSNLGTSPYTYNFLVYNMNGALIANGLFTKVSSAAQSFTFSPPAQGTDTVNVLVTDSASTPVTTNSAASTLKVYSAPSIAGPLPSNVVLDAGQVEVYNAVVSGGIGPFTVNLVASNGTVMLPSITGVPGGLVTFGYFFPPQGLQSYNVVAVDMGTSVPYTFNSGSNTVQVNPAPRAFAPNPSNSVLDSGQWETFNALILFGTAPYTVKLVSSTGLVVNTITGSMGGIVTFGSFKPPAGVDSYNVIATDSSPAGHETFNSTQTSIIVNPALGRPSITPLSANVDVGQSVTFTATLASGSRGTSPYTYNFTVYGSGGAVVANYLDQGVSGLTDTYTFTPSTTGIYTANVAVTDSSPGPSTTNSVTSTITAYSTPTATALTPSNGLLDSGQYETYTVALSGGVGPFTAKLVLSDGTVYNTITGAGAGTLTFGSVRPPAGTDSFNVIATDKGTTTAFTFNSTSNVIVVNAAPTATALTPSNALLDLGQWEIYNVTVSGGTPPYTLKLMTAAGGIVGMAAAASPGIVTFGPMAPPLGRDTYKVSVTDSSPAGQETFNSAGNTVIVSNALQALQIATPSQLIDLGASITLTALPLLPVPTPDGTSPYTYNFLVYNSAGALVANGIYTTNAIGQQFTFTPSNTGTYTVNVFETDSASTPETTNNVFPTRITVDSTPTVAISPSNAVLDSGQYETYYALAIGGAGPYLLNLVASNGVTIASNTGTFLGGPVALGPFIPPAGADSYNVIATDVGAHNFVFNSTENTILVNNDLGIPNLVPYTANLDIGQPITLTASLVSGQAGTVPYTYNFTVYNSIGSVVANYLVSGVQGISNSFTFTPAAVGIYTANVSVTDGSPAPETTNSAMSTITVTNTVLQAPTPPILNVTSLGLGQNILISNSVVSGGIPPYTYDFIILNQTTGTAIAASGPQSNDMFVWTANVAGSFVANVIVSDSSATPEVENSVYSSAFTVIAPSSGCGSNCGGGGGGGGGGGSGGGGGGGTFRPVINATGDCYLVTDVAPDGEFGITANGQYVVNVTENYITPTFAGVTVNNQNYELNVSQVYPVSSEYTIELLGISYLPIIQTISLEICSAPTASPKTAPASNNSTVTTPSKPSSTTNGTQTNSTSVSTVPTSNTPANTVLQQSASTPLNPIAAQAVPGLGGFAAAGLGTSRLRRKLMRGKHHEGYWKNDPAFLKTLEEAGVFEIATFAIAIALFVFNYPIFAAMAALGFGISVAYLVDRVTSKRDGKKLSYVRKDGLRRFVEEFGVAEGALAIVTVLALVNSHYIVGISLAFILGIGAAYFVDRSREIELILATEAATASVPYIGKTGEAKAKKQKKI